MDLIKISAKAVPGALLKEVKPGKKNHMLLIWKTNRYKHIQIKLSHFSDQIDTAKFYLDSKKIKLSKRIMIH